MILVSAIIAIVPMLIYLLLIWQFDRYDREPISLVLLNYFWGAVGAIFLSYIGSNYLLKFIGIFVQDPQTLDYSQTFIAAPLVEEITKGLFLFFTVQNIKFDNLTDGIVYGGAIGLGFGMTENFLYFITYSDTLSQWLTIIIIRTLFSAVMHGVATATFGAMLGYSKFKPTNSKIFYTLIGISNAIFIHFAWNITVSFESTALLGFLFLIFSVSIFIVIFSISLSREKKIIYTELKGEFELGLIPEAHLNILNSVSRTRKGWIDESIRKTYTRSATTLAFRKLQFKNSVGRSKFYYEKEVEHYRNFIKKLLDEKNK
ncbi:MAG: hypothetical protein CO128_05545 [Ignavibacteriales bacterium CG_4_9_14_3_um_filter_30_11]|nr:MAG: hypothetical protein CO128_05545 [Ignavibacteriales bacterium CG_4_9_14_3_um_filter_30_11]